MDILFSLLKYSALILTFVNLKDTMRICFNKFTYVSLHL